MFKYDNGMLVYNLLKVFKHKEVYNFPIHFIDMLYSVSLTYNNANNYTQNFWLGIGDKTNSSIKIFISNQNDTTIGMIVIGCWK